MSVMKTVLILGCYLFAFQLDQALSPLEKLTAIVSAITHDLDHPGVNQAFLIATSNHLAALYKVRIFTNASVAPFIILIY